MAARGTSPEEPGAAPGAPEEEGARRAPVPFSPLEYLGPVLAILLVLLAGVWLLGRARERAGERPPPAPDPRRFQVPLPGSEARPR